ncbi:MAG: alpha/beta hydrolase [Clostridia bacterium]|nr:alpha/beta hydrolase [Clostridia bacterium]
MIYNVQDFGADYEALGVLPSARKATLTSYILSPVEVEWKERPAIIICPGGGYEFTSPREAEPVALKFLAAGFHCFILDYSVEPTGWPAACCELSKAVSYVRSIADENRIDKDKIFVCGFSAGGHLAASLGVHYDKEIVRKFSGVTGLENKPNGMILCYPVITDHDTHEGTKRIFVAGRDEAKEFFGLENHVTKDTPKTFIWTTFEDESVPMVSTTRFVNALVEHGVPCEVHIFPKGDHGLALADRQTGAVVKEVSAWIDMAIRWVNQF